MTFLVVIALNSDTRDPLTSLSRCHEGSGSMVCLERNSGACDARVKAAKIWLLAQPTEEFDPVSCP